MEARECLPLNMKYYEALSIYQYLNRSCLVEEAHISFSISAIYPVDGPAGIVLNNYLHHFQGLFPTILKMVHVKLQHVKSVTQLEERFACRLNEGLNKERCLTQGGICDSMSRGQHTQREHQQACTSLLYINQTRDNLANIEAKLTNIVS